MAEPPEYRLPPTAKPQRYELELAPDLDRATFEGRETITVSVGPSLFVYAVRCARPRLCAAAEPRTVSAAGTASGEAVAAEQPAIVATPNVASAAAASSFVVSVLDMTDPLSVRG